MTKSDMENNVHRVEWPASPHTSEFLVTNLLYSMPVRRPHDAEPPLGPH